jgi:hypothetical protein
MVLPFQFQNLTVLKCQFFKLYHSERSEESNLTLRCRQINLLILIQSEFVICTLLFHCLVKTGVYPRDWADGAESDLDDLYDED